MEVRPHDRQPLEGLDRLVVFVAETDDRFGVTVCAASTLLEFTDTDSVDVRRHDPQDD